MAKFLGFVLFVSGCAVSVLLGDSATAVPTIQVIDKVGTFVIKYGDKVVMICEHKAVNCTLVNKEGLSVNSSGSLIYPSYWGTLTPGTGIELTPNAKSLVNSVERQR